MSFVDERDLATKEGSLTLIDDMFFYLQFDATKPFPVQDASFDWIYSEHFIEHIPQHIALQWFKEMRRLLKVCGTIRVSTPDLEKYIKGWVLPSLEVRIMDNLIILIEKQVYKNVTHFGGQIPEDLEVFLRRHPSHIDGQFECDQSQYRSTDFLSAS